MAATCAACSFTFRDEQDPFCQFCPKCGKSRTKQKTATLVEFTEARKRKLAGSSTRSNKKVSASSSTATSRNIVEINIGLASIDETSSVLKKRQGRMPLKVLHNINRNELKDLAIKKYARFDQNFCATDEYVLLYPDLKEVAFNPGTVNPFKLNEYKEDLGKPYQKLVFFLCQECDLSESLSLSASAGGGKKKKVPPVIQIEEGDERKSYVNDSYLYEPTNFDSNELFHDMSLPRAAIKLSFIINCFFIIV